MRHGAFRRAVVATLALGLTLGAGAASTGFFSLSREADGRWQVRDPNGQPFVIRGVDHVSYNGHYCSFDKRRHYQETNLRQFPSREAWNVDTIAKLKAWGFNMLANAHDGALRHRGIPYAYFLWMGQGFCAQGGKGACLTAEAGGCGKAFPNVFATNFVSWCEAWARRNCTPLRDDPELVGYFIDNELNFGFLQDMPAERRRAIVERYFAVTTAAIRKVDPHHLILGCRFAGSAFDEDLECVGRYCDIVSVNVYPWADLDRHVVLTSRKPNAQTIAEFFRTYSRKAGGKPLMVTEWSFPSLDSGVPSTGGAGMRVNTQAERAEASELFARTMLALPEFVGYDYFMWVDEPWLGISPGFREDSNYGLVSEAGRVYEELTDMFTRLHAEVASGKRIEMPRERTVDDPYLKDFPAALKGLGWKGIGEAPAFVSSGRDWRIENADGLVLEGKIGGGLVTSVKTRPHGRLGSVHAMLECRCGEKHSYCSLGPVCSVTNAVADGVRRVTLVGAGEMLGNRVEMTYEIVVPNRGSSFAVNLLEIANRGSADFEVVRVYVMQHSDFYREKTRSPPLIRNLWHSPLRDGWDAKDGRYFGVMTRATMADAVYYWVSADKGVPHPDAMFVPPERLILKPQATWSPEGGMWYLVVVDR